MVMKRLLIAGTLTLLIFSGCGKKEEPARTKMELLQSDLADLKTKDHPGLKIFDQDSNGTFTKIFGGTSKEDVSAYLDARVHHYFDPLDRETYVYPASVLEQTWLRGSDAKVSGGHSGAANVGTTLWLAGTIAKTPVTYVDHGQSFPVESTRTGIVMLEEGYLESEPAKDGSTIQLPPEYRQMILMHEARHSDCTGGLSNADATEISGDTSIDGLDKTLHTIHCGHLHVKCPAESDYAGIQACDSEAWGAYAVGEYFYRGVAQDPDISSYNFQIARAVIIDMQTRTLVRRSGEPDMSSEGFRD